ncbi:preprotein translocase subunit SecE [Arthrobacter caoxuetaonis]|uniref:Protein translocase subunit SecE n=1 Tax=Arthrobacter caoxuetaonis TaxID=2886935 RepID=A0A9X1MI89_9MICC|nr:preprotein translocase subunit SecE [Arthrobacter caoxuetaonis]MCC3299765.1 preprotein translocase subunit SecE [Arthrobacter caoxuetaonis]USQ59334.1 preprotein translocase subunit SecE [Arthrobacter caoxuetaonis]
MTQTLEAEEQPARIGVPSKDGKRGFFGAVILYIRQVIGELRKVVKPTRGELFKMTGIVLAFVAVMILLITGLDLLFGSLSSLVFSSGGEQ